MKSVGISAIGLWIPAFAGMTCYGDGVKGIPMESIRM